MEKVTYIIPVHEYTEEVKKYTTKAFESLAKLEGTENFEVSLVGPIDVITNMQQLFLESKAKQTITLVPTNEKDLFEKINIAVVKCITPYFSVLEFDDEFYPYWNRIAQEYIDDNRDSVILPIIDLTNTNGEIVAFANELAWDASFGEDTLGYLTLNDLLIFRDFITSGAYIKTEDFLSIGKLKPEMKVAAWYEYLLRVTSNGKKVFVAPRIGYKHTIGRENSYLATISNKLTKEDVALIGQIIDSYKPADKSN